MEHRDVSGWNTGVPPHCRGVAGWTSHQTVWVILSPRRDPHRKSNDQSPAFSAHCPAAATPTLLLHDWFYQINDDNSLTSTICDYYRIFILLFQKKAFTFCAEEEPVGSWRHGTSIPRDFDVVHILVGKCGSEEHRNQSSTWSDKFCVV